MKEGKRNKAEQDSGWRRRGGKKKREKEPPKWLLSCIKLVISVIRGKSIAEARSIRGNGNSVYPFLPLYVTSSLMISSLLPLIALLQRPVHLFCAARPEKRPTHLLHSAPLHWKSPYLLTTTGVISVGVQFCQRCLANILTLAWQPEQVFKQIPSNLILKVHRLITAGLCCSGHSKKKRGTMTFCASKIDCLWTSFLVNLTTLLS